MALQVPPQPRRDPVSGNSVPIGATQKEVRDDVPAKLSDGEYVVPADVVRFFGVKYFENAVDKAKQGMLELKEKGRINGEKPKPAPQKPGQAPQKGKLPFTREQLMGQAMSTPTPAGRPQGTVPGSMLGKPPVKMAQGGLTNPTADIEVNLGYEVKTYKNDAGEYMSIVYINGQPIQQIPEGYSLVETDAEGNEITTEPVAEASEVEVKTDTTTNQEKDTNSAQEDDTNVATQEQYTWDQDPSSWSAQQFEDALNQKGTTKAIAAVMAAVSPTLGLGINKGYNKTMENAASEMKTRLEDPDIPQEEKAMYEDLLKQYEAAGVDVEDTESNKLVDTIKNLFGLNKDTTSTTTEETAAETATGTGSSGTGVSDREGTDYSLWDSSEGQASTSVAGKEDLSFGDEVGSAIDTGGSAGASGSGTQSKDTVTTQDLVGTSMGGGFGTTDLGFDNASKEVIKP